MNIDLPKSFATEADAIAFLRTAGVVIGSVSPQGEDRPAAVGAELPATPKSWGWTRRPGDQYPNLYQGLLDMSQVKAVQAPQQQNGWTRLDTIVQALGEHRFASAHAAEPFLRPENLGAFLKVCPKGYLCFLERYRDGGQSLRVVCLYVHVGRVVARNGCAGDVGGFGADCSFAVSELDASALSPAP